MPTRRVVTEPRNEHYMRQLRKNYAVCARTRELEDPIGINKDSGTKYTIHIYRLELHHNPRRRSCISLRNQCFSVLPQYTHVWRSHPDSIEPVLVVPFAVEIPLSRYRSTKDLGPEKSTLSSFYNLLIYGAGRMVHDNRALFIVNLGIDSCVTDEVDNPLLALVLAQT